MKSKNQIIKELTEHGISVIESYYEDFFCKDSIKEIDDIIDKNKNNVLSLRNEETSGDQRLFKIENQSKTGKKFKDDTFISSILQSVSQKKISSYFVLGGKLKYNPDIIKNSGGGWHRDSENCQLKALVYLNDVDYSNGPFLFIRNSKSFDVSRRSNYSKRSLLQNIFILIGKMKLKDPRYDDQSINNFINKNKIIPEEIIGKAGTLVLFDGSFIHRGKNIEKGTRYSFTNYFYDDNIRSRYLINKRFQKLYIKKSFR